MSGTVKKVAAPTISRPGGSRPGAGRKRFPDNQGRTATISIKVQQDLHDFWRMCEPQQREQLTQELLRTIRKACIESQII